MSHGWEEWCRGTLEVMTRCAVPLSLVYMLTAGCQGPPSRHVEVRAESDANPLGLFAAPSDFDRTGCDVGGSLGDVALPGIWHLDLALDSGRHVPVPVRVEQTDKGLSAAFFGQDFDSVARDTEDIFLRRAWYDKRADVDRVRALNACAVREDGGLFGRYASCTDGDCALGRFVAYRVDPLSEPESAGLTVLGTFSGGEEPWPDLTANVRYRGGFAYLARFGDGLRVVDVSDPTNPAERGHLSVADTEFEFFNDVKVVDASDGRRYALMASSARGVVVVDVSNPDRPEVVNRFPSVSGQFTEVHTLFVEGPRAYLANTNVAGLQIYDIADPRDVLKLGEWVHPDQEAEGGYLHDLFVSDGRVYLNYWNLGLVIVDAKRAPATPRLVGVFNEYAPRTSHSVWVTEVDGRRVAIHGDEGFGAHVRIVDVDDRAASFLNVIATYQTRPHVSVHNILATGPLAFVTYYQDGLRVLDLSRPQAPELVGHFHSWPGESADYGMSFYEGAIGVDYDAATGRIYLADTHRGLFILQRAR